MEHLIKISIWISLILILSGVEGFPTNNEVQSQIPSQNSYYMRPYYYYPQPHYYHHPTFWYPPKMPSPPLPRTPKVPQVPQVPQMSQPLTQPPQPPELMGCANSPSCSSACLKNWYNSWYYPGSHYPKAESESNSTSGSDEKSLPDCQYSDCGNENFGLSCGLRPNYGYEKSPCGLTRGWPNSYCWNNFPSTYCDENLCTYDCQSLGHTGGYCEKTPAANTYYSVVNSRCRCFKKPIIEKQPAVKEDSSNDENVTNAHG